MEAGGGLHLPVAPRIPTSLSFPGLQLSPSLQPPVHQPSRRIQSRLGRDTGYIIISRFSCGTQKRERERERVSGQRAPGISTDDALARQILRALSAGVGGRVVDARFFFLPVEILRAWMENDAR